MVSLGCQPFFETFFEKLFFVFGGLVFLYCKFIIPLKELEVNIFLVIFSDIFFTIGLKSRRDTSRKLQKKGRPRSCRLIAPAALPYIYVPPSYVARVGGCGIAEEGQSGTVRVGRCTHFSLTYILSHFLRPLSTFFCIKGLP